MPERGSDLFEKTSTSGIRVTLYAAPGGDLKSWLRVYDASGNELFKQQLLALGGEFGFSEDDHLVWCTTLNSPSTKYACQFLVYLIETGELVLKLNSLLGVQCVRWIVDEDGRERVWVQSGWPYDARPRQSRKTSANV